MIITKSAALPALVEGVASSVQKKRLHLQHDPIIHSFFLLFMLH